MRGSRSLFSAAQTFQFGAPHTLCSSSSLYIRPLATPPPQASTSAPMSSAGPSRPASATSRPTVPTLSEAFQLFPAVYTSAEVEQLLRASLWKLDRVDTARRRRGRRRTGGSAEAGEVSVGGTRRAGQEAFEGEYGFEDGHFDSVIHHYRETLISSLSPPDAQWPDLLPLLQRAYDLLPSSAPARPRLDTSTRSTPPHTSTHLLHLAPHGQILPHVDNLQASGSVIIGVSLGAERVLRLEPKEADGLDVASGGGGEGGGGGVGGGWDVRLPSGSVYLQKDEVRYGYKHSVLPYSHEGSVWDGKRLEEGQRISIMIRDAPTHAAKL